MNLAKAKENISGKIKATSMARPKASIRPKTNVPFLTKLADMNEGKVMTSIWSKERGKKAKIRAKAKTPTKKKIFN